MYSVEVTGPFAVPARTRVVRVSSVLPLLVVVGYWRFGAVPRAVPVVWNQYTFYRCRAAKVAQLMANGADGPATGRRPAEGAH